MTAASPIALSKTERPQSPSKQMFPAQVRSGDRLVTEVSALVTKVRVQPETSCAGAGDCGKKSRKCIRNDAQRDEGERNGSRGASAAEFLSGVGDASLHARHRFARSAGERVRG